MAAPRSFPVYPKNPLKHGGGASIKIAQRPHYLGKHGSEASYREYERLRLEHAFGKPMPALPAVAGDTIDDLISAWLQAEPRGVDNAEVQRICRACMPLARLFGATSADEFRANRLRAVQEAMISQSWMTPEERERCGPWSRDYINKNIERIVRVFRWAESTERVPMGTTEHLRTVPDIQLNNRRVRINQPRQPVDWKAQAEPCLKFLAPVVKAMLIVQYHGGLRPSEVCTIRRCEIDQASTPGVWLYKPAHHKGTWRGHSLVKALGPVAQTALAPWLMAAEPEGYVFPPAKRRNGAEFYMENGYAQAVRRAIRDAKVKPFCLYSLRHGAARNAESVGGVAGAAALLGHHSVETTQQYLDRQRIALAVEVARKIG